MLLFCQNAMLRREDGNALILLPLCFFYSKRELSNEYLLAKIGFDTTEKVLFEGGQLMVYLLFVSFLNEPSEC